MYPLRLDEPTFVRPLLEHLFPLKTSKRDFIQLVVEDNSTLYIECSIDISRDAESRPSVKRISNNQDIISPSIVLYV